MSVSEYLQVEWLCDYILEDVDFLVLYFFGSILSSNLSFKPHFFSCINARHHQNYIKQYFVSLVVNKF